MSKTITVKGIGKATAKPDYVVISMELESTHKSYDKAMSIAANNIQQLTETLCGIGFEKESLKTTNFDVDTDYDRVQDYNGHYKSVFVGYEVTHYLKLAFDFSMDRLSETLSAVFECSSHPQLSISFTVKDTTAINEEMLRSAAANARKKAEILCEASGVKMGALIAIDYNWTELNFHSRTQYMLRERTRDFGMTDSAIDIEPDDIDVSDTATFVWEIE